MFRRWTFLLAASIFLIACYLLYSSLDASNTKRKLFINKGAEEISDLEDRLKQLQNELNENEKMINKIRVNVAEKLGDAGHKPKPPTETKLSEKDSSKHIVSKLAPAKPTSPSGDVCDFSSRKQASPDVQMLDVYDLLPFDNIDGGVWKQGWEITYDKDTVEKEPQLHVFVIPHSHTDPGWIKTFERYYQDQTKHILDNMIIKLSKTPDMKFIYAEMSFFERWWQDIDDTKRQLVKKLIENQQFEIVTGAWVMTDEANSHYFATVEQMIEGHQWLENHLGYKPRNHWSIDPFGLTSTLSYFLKLANFTSMVVQRVHYSIKKHFAKEKTLEFMWRPIWSGNEKMDIFCHMFPFYSYDIPHTCGPDPKVCCQFDFRRLPGFGVTCPWHVPPQAITNENVESRAMTILDQYRKKAQLYKTNVLLIPLGDDFRYDTMEEWDAQFSNYKRLFDYMNSRKDWNVKAQFGTLADYFAALYKRTKTVPGQKPNDFNVLTGDFFTYADRDDHYWSGYYTSRPFYKRMDRVLQNYLRGAEILFSLAFSSEESTQSSNFPVSQLFSELVEARRNLGLFQHHDGVTGTAKDHVVVDYGQRMLQAIMSCRKIISVSTYSLLAKDKKTAGQAQENVMAFDFDERLPNHDSVPEKIIMNLEGSTPRILLVYNSLATTRNDVVCIHTDTVKVDIRDENDVAVPIQISPVIFKDRGRMEVSNTVFEVCWLATVPPIAVNVYRVLHSETVPQKSMAVVKSNLDFVLSGTFRVEKLDSSNFEIKTPYYEASFDSVTGFLKTLKSSSSDAPLPMELEFVKYGTTNKKDQSGAYLFLPDGPAQKLRTDGNRVVVVEGPLVSAVHVVMPQVKHTVLLSHAEAVESEAIRISNLVDITREENYELVMRLKSGIANTDRIFYTDLNGFQIVKRKYVTKIPLQGNVYPMSASAFIEDNVHRLSLLSGQPLGVGSMEVGWLEVFLDRRLIQDDNRGLFQTVTDNKVTPDHFSLVLERRKPDSALNMDEQRVAYHTLTAHLASLSLLYPMFLMFQKDKSVGTQALKSLHVFHQSLPCDVHLVNLRTLEQPQEYSKSTTGQTINVKPKLKWALILHRIGVDCSVASNPAVSCQFSNGQVDLSKFFGGLSISEVEETSLTLMHVLNAHVDPAQVSLTPMDVRTFRVRLK